MTDHFHRKTCKRYDVPGDVHELTFSCFKRRQFLIYGRTRQYFGEAVIKAREKHRFDLWAYVVMPEHVHLLIWPREDNYSISKILNTIKQSVSRRVLIYVRKHKLPTLKLMATGQKDRPYRFWLDGGGYDRNITSLKVLSSVFDYIHNNPVERGLVATTGDWEYSSAAEWEGSRESPIPIDKGSFPVL